MSEDDLFPFLDRLLGEIQYIHQDLSRMVEGYQDAVDRARERGRVDDETIALLRGLPGAKYRVMSEYVRQQWLLLDGEVRKRFPRPIDVERAERHADADTGESGEGTLRALGRD